MMKKQIITHIVMIVELVLVNVFTPPSKKPSTHGTGGRDSGIFDLLKNHYIH